MTTVHIDNGATFGALIRQARQEMGISGRVAAQRSGVSHSTLVQLESGRLPMGETMIVLLKFYKITATVGLDPKEGT